MYLAGTINGRMSIEQVDMNSEISASLKQKTELARADRSKRKVIAVSDEKMMNAKQKLRLTSPLEASTSLSAERKSSSWHDSRSVSRPLVSSGPTAASPIHTLKPLLPAAPKTTAAATASAVPPVQTELDHSWIVLRSLPLAVSARDVEDFLDGIQLARRTSLPSTSLPQSVEPPPAAPSAATLGTSTSTASTESATSCRMLAVFQGAPWCGMGVGEIDKCGVMVDMYVEMLSSHGAFVAEKRSGEPLRVSSLSSKTSHGTIHPQVVCGGVSPGSLTLAEVFWAWGVGLELTGKRSAGDTLRDVSRDFKELPVTLFLSPRGSLTPAVLMTKWPAFTALVSLALKKRRNPHAMMHIFATSPLEHDAFLGPGRMPSAGDSACGEVNEVSRLLDALGQLWVAIAIGASDEEETPNPAEQTKAKSTRLAVSVLARSIQAFRCLERYLRLQC
jgi:hypothetical protein